MEGLKVGHYTNSVDGTGISVFLFEQSANGACWVGGSAVASHELLVLDPEHSASKVHGLALTGGSAYGLFAAQGMMTYLTERHIGHPTSHGVVPIVPAAAIYDLAFKKAVYPDAIDAYQACRTANTNNQESGQIGAGTGATVGKVIKEARLMHGGLGRVHMQIDEIEVIAYAVVNCVGDVRDERGSIIAGACDTNGRFLNSEKYLLSGHMGDHLFSKTNSTLVAVFTNAKFDKSELKRIAKMATAGIARAIAPIFTRFDGDILFCFSLGDKACAELILGTMAAEAVRLSILDSVKNSTVVMPAEAGIQSLKS